jgi:hypothetical protein
MVLIEKRGMNMISEVRELNLDDLTAISGGGFTGPVFSGVKQLGIGGTRTSGGGSGPHRGGVDPNPQLGTDYSGDSAGGGGGSGGYMGDGNYLRPF